MNRRRFFTLLPAIALSPLAQFPDRPQTTVTRTLEELNEWVVWADVYRWLHENQLKRHEAKIGWLLTKVFDVGVKPEKLKQI